MVGDMASLKRSWPTLLTHIGALIPLVWIIADVVGGNMVDPIEEMTLRTGAVALFLLMLSLACTPLYTFFRIRQVVSLRRPLGLYAFMYAFLHWLVFVGIDYGFRLDLIQRDVLAKRYIQAGLASFVILVPLAMTSTKGWIKRLGKNWKHLHRLVYLAAVLAVVHFWLLVKFDKTEPQIYAIVLAILLVARLPIWKRLLLKR